jgi:hypothetical protein
VKDISSLFLASLVSPAAAGFALLLAIPAHFLGQQIQTDYAKEVAKERWAKYGHHIREALATVQWYRSLENPTSQQTVKFNMAKEVLWHNNVLY